MPIIYHSNPTKWHDIVTYINCVRQEFPDLDAAIASALEPDLAPFPREDPEPEANPDLSTLMETAPWHNWGIRRSRRQGTTCTTVRSPAEFIHNGIIRSDPATPSTPTLVNHTQERPPPAQIKRKKN